MNASGGAGGYLTVAPHCALKRLETPALYDRRADELYELDEEALRFLASGPGVNVDWENTAPALEGRGLGAGGTGTLPTSALILPPRR